MKQLFAPFFLILTVAATACGPDVQPGGDDDSVADAGECVPTSSTEVCTGGGDEDCDGAYNCDDDECAGIGDCPACGEAQHLEGQPLPLPDDGSCTSAYTSTINITGLPDGALLDDMSDFLGICVTMEHSWLRDLQIEMSTPRGDVIQLQMFLGAMCPPEGGCEIFMGTPNDSDFGTTPTPGTGAEYCWTPTATELDMLGFAATQPSGHLDLPAGDYKAASGFDAIIGTPLNGAWTIKVSDCWGADNGFIFNWTVMFNSELVEDCDEPIG